MLYEYKCPACGKVSELFRRMKYRNRAAKCECGAIMNRLITLPSTDNKNYSHAIHSVAMGVNQNQVSEHRRMFPDIPMSDQGDIIVKNGASEKKINKILAGAFSEKQR